MSQSYRNLIAGGIVLQLAMLDIYFTIKAGMGGPMWWKFILYALLIIVMRFPARG